MGTGMVEESRSAMTPTPQKPSFARAGSAASFHQPMIPRKNCFKKGSLSCFWHVH